MFCPGCGAEYDPGVTICGECQVALIADAPDLGPHFQDMVCVLESNDQTEIAMAESLLQGAEIPYAVQHGEAQSVFGVLDASIEVRPEFAEAAAELLADLNEGVSPDDLDALYEEEDEDDSL